MRNWEPANIMLLILILIVPFFLIIVFLDAWLFPETAAGKEYNNATDIIKYLIGACIGLLAGEFKIKIIKSYENENYNYYHQKIRV